jgi:hypothetical protein
VCSGCIDTDEDARHRGDRGAYRVDIERGITGIARDDDGTAEWAIERIRRYG